MEKESDRIIYQNNIKGTEFTANLIRCEQCKIHFSKENICQACQLKTLVKEKFYYDILDEELDLLIKMFTYGTGIITEKVKMK